MQKENMYASYHNHTWRCRHAFGTEREYVEAAIAGGLRTFGFSDHTPQPYPDDYVCGSKMSLGELEGYVDTVLELKKEYRDDIEILLGMEVEYYPELFDKLLEITAQYPMEYFLLGQHFLHNEYDCDGIYTGIPTGSVEKLAQYSAQCIEAMETGAFSYLAHPDLINFTGDPEVYEKYMRPICRAAKRENIPLEINMLGVREDRQYPNRRFWKMAGEEGCSAIIGADAHRPEYVTDAVTLERAYRIANDNGLTVLRELPLRRPVRR